MSEIEINISKYSIQEKYGKLNGPQNVMLDITQKCNMHCMHCYNYSGDCMYNDLNDEQMIDVARQLLEIKPCLVCLCGGLHSQEIRNEIKKSIAEIYKLKYEVIKLAGDFTTVNANNRNNTGEN